MEEEEQVVQDETEDGGSATADNGVVVVGFCKALGRGYPL